MDTNVTNNNAPSFGLRYESEWCHNNILTLFQAIITSKTDLEMQIFIF